MALTVEDGTGVAGANTYVSLAEADAYLAAFGGKWLTLTPPEKEQRLVQGFLIVDDASTYHYSGFVEDPAQWTLWPRVGATRYRGPGVPEASIPQEVKRAQMVAAEGLAEGSIVWGSSATDRAVKSESVEGVGSFSYFAAGEGVVQPKPVGPYGGVGWPQVTGILAPLLDRGAYSAVPNAGLSGFTRPTYGGIWDVGMHDGYGTRDDTPMTRYEDGARPNEGDASDHVTFNPTLP